MKVISSLESAYSIRKGEVIEHPIFERLLVDFICKESGEDDYQMWCRLLDFNDTLRRFNGMDLVRIKHKRRTRVRLVKNDEK